MKLKEIFWYQVALYKWYKYKWHKYKASYQLKKVLYLSPRLLKVNIFERLRNKVLFIKSLLNFN